MESGAGAAVMAARTRASMASRMTAAFMGSWQHRLHNELIHPHAFGVAVHPTPRLMGQCVHFLVVHPTNLQLLPVFPLKMK